MSVLHVWHAKFGGENKIFSSCGRYSFMFISPVRKFDILAIEAPKSEGNLKGKNKLFHDSVHYIMAT